MLVRQLKRAAVVSTFAALVVLRLAIVRSWAKPAGDGLQYYRLAEGLREHGRFAFAGPPLPLSFSRLPGYPVFLWLTSLGQPLVIDEHIARAVRWNVAFDVGTALLLLLAARAAGMRRAWLAALAVLALPTLWLMSCYALTESLSMMLTAAILAGSVVTLRRGTLAPALAMGACAGLAQLVRFDAICLWPIMIYACLRAPVERRRRVVLVAATLATALALFSPWPLRNLVRFGAPHVAATTWRTWDGRPLATGPIQWARTWSDSSRGALFELYFVNDRPFPLEHDDAIPEGSYDDEAGRQRLFALFERYNHERLSPTVNDEFVTLARDRLRHHPWRTIFVLPARRIARLFSAEPEYEMPMQVSWLGLPQHRPWLIRADRLLFVLAAIGALLLWRRRQRQWLWLVLPALALRVGLYSFAIPHATTERYLVEAFPLFIFLAMPVAD
ncbi:MAG TPA: hypothetical protein VHB97_11905 [Polyangia bacterium]|jgi:4-amino-4-deoxy-L-arabinose transferase-like glycosyltransferase|nr:hypothetical protein [Polyangia bacterium]